MEIFSESVSFVANGITYNIPKMREVISKINSFNGFELKELEPNIKELSVNNVSNKEELIKKIKEEIPIAIFQDKYVSVVINNNDTQLTINSTKQEKNPMNVVDIFEGILTANADMLENLTFIGISFSRRVNAKQEKLKLLNESINTIKNWNNNKTFILTIPFDYSDFILTCKIQKLIPTNIKNKERSYQFDAIFNFKMNKADANQKILKDIIARYKDNAYYSLFMEKYNEFTNFKDIQ